ncbi:uncharacterized protein LOC121386142 [Gigantopelta aegis]|uniref:uncharacterized protein LOC121386142 n=1 Tax=Gigantopelta aegis TaxID=1735272 RepID=UPI001B88D13E|nr:uncharacterized protein LOC121386142 [Gigantopelta aegis]
MTGCNQGGQKGTSRVREGERVQAENNATYGGHFHVGSGNNKLESDSFFISVQEGHKTNLQIVVFVTEECIPLGERIVGISQGNPIEDSVSFFNIQMGIKDPSVFDVPKVCDDTTLELVSISNQLKQYRIFGF